MVPPPEHFKCGLNVELGRTCQNAAGAQTRPRRPWLARIAEVHGQGAPEALPCLSSLPVAMTSASPLCRALASETFGGRATARGHVIGNAKALGRRFRCSLFLHRDKTPPLAVSRGGGRDAT